ncbi:MFS transporter [Lederbergia galactosidilytica]|uniref:MFS transporter n=1 Tax=Lederbergia galactosidilytica TaxID=217031 RepID=A0A177ZRE9_9BACI|nr:MFS transporter [Lederbergia galactosidilytica]KRG12789.1 MFS transporter [Virgibacillus soli]MBP1917007.1 MFS family permease [Lederbergia galactosidilytica]OAK70551.1 MFS transporter [Lederbergia galactosidilytica]
MKETTLDQLHIFITMFIISLIMSVQGPIFTPYAAMLGASSVMIGIMLSTSQLASLTGNLIVGPLVDRYGKRLFITLPLLLSGFLYIAHGFTATSTSLLALRSMNSFVLAFLMPAALTFISGYAANRRQQGKNMAIIGILGMIANIVAPLIGGKLGATIGYANTYVVIGSALLFIAIYTMIFLRDRQMLLVNRKTSKPTHFFHVFKSPQLQLVYLTGFAVMYIHGVIIYEIPYLTVEQGISTMNTGQLFSFMAIGTLLSLSLFFIHRFDPINRMMVGLFLMCISLSVFFNGLLSLPIFLFSMGICFGLTMPAAATAVTGAVRKEEHGRAFGVMSAVYSLGMIISSFMTAVIRQIISPYFIAFLVGMCFLTLIGYLKFRTPKSRSIEVERY